MARKSYGIPAKSAIRALLILEYFEEMQRPLSLKAISDRFEWAASSASALLKNLANLDYLSYDVENRTYLPTLRLSRLGGWLEKRILEDGVADLVTNLQIRTQETVVITTINDLYVDFLYFDESAQHVDQFPGPDKVGYPRRGVAITCPFSWVLLKDYNESRLESLYLRSKARKLFDPQQLSWPEFNKQVEQTRKSQYIIVKPWPYPDSSVLVTLVPVLPFGRRVALGIGASTERMESKMPDLLSIIDEELKNIVVKEGASALSTEEHNFRLSEIQVKAPLFSSVESVPTYSGVDRTII